jgi:membrane protein implicated in regulation of membrane protease activity
VFYIYLFAAVAGCLLVGVSMAGIGAGDGDGDGGDDAHALGDGQSDTHALTDGQGGHDAADHGGDHGHHGGALSGLGAAAGVLFSLQLWTYLLAFGGLTGLLLRTLAHVGEPAAGLCALAVGLGTGFTARKVMRRMTAIGDSGTVEQDKLIGTSAQVLIPADAGRTGKIRLLARGQTLDMLARASDGKALITGTEVVIVDMKDGIAEVTPELPELPDLPSTQDEASRKQLGAAQAASAPQSPPSTKG